MRSRKFRQGDVWLCRLDPTEGQEIRKTRPCAIISPDGMNTYLGTVIVMPLTSGSHPARFRARSTFRDVPGLLLGDRIRCLSTGRLLKYIGPLGSEGLSAALAVLREMFDE